MKDNIFLLSLIGFLFIGCNNDIIQLEKKEQFKYSPLHTAVRLNNLEHVKLLINDKDLNISDPYGDSPLMDALRNNNTEIAHFLICNGADISFLDKNSYSPMDIAVRNNNTQLVRLLNSNDINLYCGNSFLKKELSTIQSKDIKFYKNLLSFTFYKETNLNDEFKNKLNTFIPKFISIIEKEKDKIERILIKNHTTSFANNQHTQIGMFIANTKISQKNADEILEYVNKSIDSSNKIKFEAIGMSSKEVIIINGKEDTFNSKRTEFKIILK
jgi:ankyrin repeat protein